MLSCANNNTVMAKAPPAVAPALIRHAVCLVLGAPLIGASSQAEALLRDTLFLQANSAITYESNVFRLADGISDAAAASFLHGRPKSAFSYAVGAGARIDMPIKRQRFRAEMSATNHEYINFHELNYLGYEARAVWEWRVGNDWHGELNAVERQGRQMATSSTAGFIPPLYRSHDALLDARYAFTARWAVQASVNTLEIAYQDPAFRLADLTLDVLSLGVLYQTPRRNAIGARLRYENGSWPHRPPELTVPFGNEYRQYTISALVDWHATGRSHIYGDIG